MLACSAAALALSRQGARGGALDPYAVGVRLDGARPSSDDPTCGPEITNRNVLFVTHAAPQSLLDDNAKLPPTTGERKVQQAVAHAAVALGFNVSVFNVPTTCDFCGDTPDVGNLSNRMIDADEAWQQRLREGTKVSWLDAATQAIDAGAYRVVTDGMATWGADPCHHALFTNETYRQRLLMVGFFGGYDPEDEAAGPMYCKLPAHQVLTAWPDAMNTFIGVHGTQLRPDRDPNRPLQGLILGKNPRAFAPGFGWNHDHTGWGYTPECVRQADSTCSDNPLQYGFGNPQKQGDPLDTQITAIKATLQVLLDANITLYTSCASLEDCNLPEGVKTLGPLKPEHYLDKLAEMSFALGVGYPLLSPAPLDALANGAAFLNPVFASPLPSFTVSALTTNNASSQHDALALLVAADGSATQQHVYPVDFTRPATLVEAALKAHAERFSAYQPEELSARRISERVCAAFTQTAAAKSRAAGSTPFASKLHNPLPDLTIPPPI